MKPKYVLPIVINILWLFVGGIIGFWAGGMKLPWLLVGILIIIIASIGINQAVFEARKKK